LTRDLVQAVPEDGALPSVVSTRMNIARAEILLSTRDSNDVLAVARTLIETELGQEDLGVVQRAQSMRVLGLVEFRAGELDAAAQWLESAAGEMTDSLLLSSTLRDLGETAFAMGKTSFSIESYNIGIEVLDRLTLVTAEEVRLGQEIDLGLRRGIAGVYARTGRVGLSIEPLRASLRVARDSGTLPLRFGCSVILAWHTVGS
jgi:hypothetical protein